MVARTHRRVERVLLQEFGGDSDAILSELGYTAHDIQSLREKLVTTNSIISDG